MTLAAVVSLSAAAGQLAAAEVEVGVIVVLLNCGTCTIVIPAVSATRGAPTFTRAFLFLGCRILSPRWDAVGCSGARGRALTLTARTQILRLLTEFGKSLCQEPTYIFYGRFTVFIDLGSFAVLDSRQPEGTRSVKSVDY